MKIKLCFDYIISHAWSIYRLHIIAHQARGKTVESVEREGDVCCEAVQRIPVAFHLNVILEPARHLSGLSCICEFGDAPRPPDGPLADAKGLLWYILEGFPLKKKKIQLKLCLGT